MKKILLFALLITSYGFMNAQVVSGLIAKYSFNAQNTVDESGNGNNASMHNLTAATDRFGNINKAYSFNGINSYVSLPSGLLLEQSISISIWFKTSLNRGCIIGHQNTAVNNNTGQFVPIAYMRYDSTLNTELWDNSPGNTNTSLTKFNDNQWHHLVLAGDNTGQNIYIDGVSQGTGNGISLLATLTHNQFGTGYIAGTWPGQSGAQGWAFFDGNLDDIRIYDRVINATEVDSLFNISNPIVLVNSITVDGQGGSSTISTNGGTLQMEATVLPVNADDATYSWYVTNGTGTAGINGLGFLTAYTNGTVEVRATANDGSGIFGTKTITISNQSVGIYENTNNSKIVAYPNPTKGIVTFNTQEQINNIVIYNLTGKSVATFSNTNNIDISNLTNDVYFAKIIAGSSKPVMQKLIKK